MQDELKILKEKNYYFIEKPETLLPEDIGYIKLEQFANLSLGKEEGKKSPIEQKTYDVIKSMQKKEMLIFDLRDCEGGSPELMRYLISFFFNKEGIPINAYHRGMDGDIEKYETIKQDFVLKMPVYILINAATFSAGESFAYAMQQFSEKNVEGMKNRFTLVGNKTGGGAHRTFPFPLFDTQTEASQISKDWFLILPITTNINSQSHTNWEGDDLTGEKPPLPHHEKGVKPDIPIKYDLALMSTNALEQNIIEFQWKKNGFNYRVIGLDNEMKTGFIPWSDLGLLPDNFPKNNKGILDNKGKLLPIILRITSRAGHTMNALTKAMEVWAEKKIINQTGRLYTQPKKKKEEQEEANQQPYSKLHKPID